MRAFVPDRPLRALGLVLAGIVALLAAGTIGAVAAMQFSDVSPTSVHAPGIGFVADTGVTVGCGGTRFCPEDPVTRAQMATFMHRLSGNAETPPSVNAASLGGMDAEDVLAEMAAMRAELDATASALVVAEARLAAFDALLDGVTRQDLGGRDTLRFAGMNLQVVNGVGANVDVANGVGNLIVGYDTDRNPAWGSGESDKSGSHYLVVGDAHNYTGHGGVVAGFFNIASGDAASVLGGANNTASGPYSSILGGAERTVDTTYGHYPQ
jgi:hypothetical protein